MDDFKYEEGYFKLKKANEELVVLFNKVLNDYKTSKLTIKTEKEKNEALIITNTNLKTELDNAYTRKEEQQRKIHDLTQELEYLQTYSKAVEGVAENYCGQNMATQSKYQELKRQSTMLLCKLGEQTEFFDFDELNDVTDSTDIVDTPTPIFEMSKIKLNHVEQIRKEKEQYEELRQENLQKRLKISSLLNQIENLKTKLEQEQSEVARFTKEMEMLMSTYTNLKEDHERMMILFSPISQLKTENRELKRTSAIIIGNMGNDEKLTEFIKINNEMKIEIMQKEQKILDLTKEIDAHNFSSLTIEIAGLKTELEEITEKLTVAEKENEKLLQENRTLKERKNSYVVAPPPPLTLPPPPPAFSIMRIFKNGKGKNRSDKLTSPSKKKPEDQQVVDLMRELEQRLNQRVKLKRKDEGQSKGSLHPGGDSTDSMSVSPGVILRSRSVPNVIASKQEENDLQNILKKFNICGIDENE